MSIIDSLQPSEVARHLANPEGPVGLAVAEWLNANNRDGVAQVLAALELKPDCSVLEVGFGNGRAAPDVVGRAANVQYSGIDISPTMVAEAIRFNRPLVSNGYAAFQLASAEQMPFADAEFDRVFSVGVVHFWKDLVAPLKEILRVMRRDGLAVMGTVDSRSAPQFARPELGFHLRSATDWTSQFRIAGFRSVESHIVESKQLTLDGAATKRYAILVLARP